MSNEQKEDSLQDANDQDFGMPMPSNEKVIELQALSKSYGDYLAVDRLSLQVNAGEVFALLGPNGAGKTTTINMLMGVLQPTSGSATICGLDSFSKRAQVMERVGYVPDEPVFYDHLRASELIRFSARMRGFDEKSCLAAMMPLLERLKIADDLEEFAHNYSKGMKKKLSLALALQHRPALLLLDEPTNGLDPYATRELHGLITEAANLGMGIFFSTHLLDQAEKLCHRVGIMHNAKLAAIGSLDELRKEARGLGNDSAQPEGSDSLEDLFFAITGHEADHENANDQGRHAESTATGPEGLGSKDE